MKRSRSYLPQLLLIAGLLIAFGAACIPAGAVTVEQEIKLGKQINEEILRQTPVSSDAEAQKEIEEYGQQLAKGVKRTEIKYHFVILKDDELNAFSIPGGYVYFNEHLWNIMRKDERIGILGHEMTHVDRRHALDAMLDAQRRQIWLAVLLTAVKANNTWGNVADLCHQIYSLKFSRIDEQQADEGSVYLCQKAGYNPAGILLAMRKIQRFETEQGGAPPKILADHPPSAERVHYLQQLLTKLGVPIPPETAKDIPNPYRIGEVTSVTNGDVEFTSSKQLAPGDVVWLMTFGWDYRYEDRTTVPAARAVVEGMASAYKAAFRILPGIAPQKIVKGLGVYLPPAPNPETGVGRVEPLTNQPGDPGQLVTSDHLDRFQRFLAREVVWNKDRSELIYDSTGYIVVTNPLANPPFISASRPCYGYAPLQSHSILAKVDDPEGNRWVGPILSIGRNSGTIEVLPDRAMDQLSRDKTAGKRYKIAFPAWDSTEPLEKRIIGTAVLKSFDKKIVLQMIGYSNGHCIDDINTGYDVYEEIKASGEK